MTLTTTDEKVKILRGVRTLLDKPKSWVQAAHAVDSNGQPIWHKDEGAVAFCLMGAAWKAAGESSDSVSNLMRSIIDPENVRDGYFVVANWNDALHRTHREVIEVLDNGISKLDPTYRPPGRTLWQRFRSWYRRGN